MYTAHCSYPRHLQDGSGTINSREEALQLGVNLIFKLKFQISRDAVESAVDAEDWIVAPKTLADYGAWFRGTFEDAGIPVAAELDATSAAELIEATIADEASP